jgi:hypothetical protein
MFPNFITGYDNLNKHIWDAHQDGNDLTMGTTIAGPKGHKGIYQ